MAKATPPAKSEQPEELHVVILNREFTLAVIPSERAQLEKAVAIVDEKMRAIRDAGKVGGVDKIAIMAALQIANEQVKNSSGRKASSSSGPAPVSNGEDAVSAETVKKVRKLNEKLETELKKQEDLF